MKRIFLIIIIFMFMLIGCSTSKAGAKNTAGDYLKTLYTFHDVSKIIDESSIMDMEDSFTALLKPYMTDKAYDDMYSSRIGYGAVLVAFYNKCNVDIDGMDFTLSSQEKEQVVYNYKVRVKFTPYDGNTPKSVDIEGQIILIKEDGKWKVNGGGHTNDREWLQLVGLANRQIK
jgi:hypothetical protein